MEANGDEKCNHISSYCASILHYVAIRCECTTHEWEEHVQLLWHNIYNDWTTPPDSSSLGNQDGMLHWYGVGRGLSQNIGTGRNLRSPTGAVALSLSAGVRPLALSASERYHERKVKTTVNTLPSHIFEHITRHFYYIACIALSSVLL